MSSANGALFDAPDTLGMARVSDCGRYRYSLHRRWDVTKPRVVWVMLNPSTADAEHDDQTIRRCMGFARSWGLGGIVVVNLYAYRATSPRDLWRAEDPVGPENDRYLAEYVTLHGGAPVVAAWGAHARPDRVAHVLSLPGMDRLQALGVTASGAPRHPSRLPYSAELAPWPAGSSR